MFRRELSIHPPGRTPANMRCIAVLSVPTPRGKVICRLNGISIGAI